MKKKVLLIAALFTAGFSFAQDQMTSKKGTPILPEAGDYAISFDAAPLTSYMGNLMNGTTGNNLGAFNLSNAADPLVLTGKYFTDANTAYRGMLRLGFGSNTATSNNVDGTGFSGETTTNNTNIAIGGGLEFRRGKGRLQGVYGPMAMISLTGGGQEFSYDSTLTVTGPRVTERTNGSSFGLNLGGFAGVEYFFAPKMSIGGEVMWTINIASNGASETTTETTNGSTTVEGGESSTFGVDTRPMGNISLNFHF
ncbi:MAG: hypothetical protein RIC95_14810 [Vicingaceae bacterium]